MSKRDDAAIGTGAALTGVGLSRTRIANSYASHATSSAQRKLSTAQGNLKTASSAPRAASAHLRGYQPNGTFVHANQARKIANAGRTSHLSHLAGEVATHKKALAAVGGKRTKLARGLLAAAPAGAAIAYAGGRQKVAKRRVTRSDVDTAAAGAVAGGAATMGAGYVAKPRNVEAKIAGNPHLQHVWSQHRKQNGVNTLKSFRSYPKQLPKAKLQRTLSYTHGGKTGMATLAAGAAVVGGAAGAAHHKVKKSAFGVDHDVSKGVKNFKAMYNSAQSVKAPVAAATGKLKPVSLKTRQTTGGMGRKA